MRDVELEKARRQARLNVRNAKRTKGFASGEKAAAVRQAIKNSRN